MRTTIRLLLAAFFPLIVGGCALVPDYREQPQVVNPFPQFHRVAVMPFFNQSEEPTLNGEEVAQAYFEELQKVPGFEVLPVGITRRVLESLNHQPSSPEDFQTLARIMGVDAILVGSITDYTPYYPPRMGLAVRWYAANPGYHEVPAGYGLPWGTSEEEFIPDRLVYEAEFALAREQLKTQDPSGQEETLSDARQAQHEELPPPTVLPNDEQANPLRPGSPPSTSNDELNSASPDMLADANTMPVPPEELIPGWPDASGFVPAPPSPAPPPMRKHSGPVIRHTRLYDGADADFTQALSEYYYFRDEARFTGWQSYLQRSQDFVRFCCYLHLSETLTARGGAAKTRVVWRWPIDRYER